MDRPNPYYIGIPEIFILVYAAHAGGKDILELSLITHKTPGAIRRMISHVESRRNASNKILARFDKRTKRLFKDELKQVEIESRRIDRQLHYITRPEKPKKQYIPKPKKTPAQKKAAKQAARKRYYDKHRARSERREESIERRAQVLELHNLGKSSAEIAGILNVALNYAPKVLLKYFGIRRVNRKKPRPIG